MLPEVIAANISDNQRPFVSPFTVFADGVAPTSYRESCKFDNVLLSLWRCLPRNVI